MSLLINGELKHDWFETQTKDGDYVRLDSQFRHWITADGSAGPTGEGGFKAEKNRYHLYVSLACPWAHRTLIFRHLKGLQDYITVSVVNPDMLEAGWSFADYPGTTGDTLYQSEFMHEIYRMAAADYTGVVTVPVLWDKQRKTIVNNESSEIIRMFNTAFNHLTDNNLDFYPSELRQQIDGINEKVYHQVNNGVYKTGFARTQAAYEKNFQRLFSALDDLEKLLSTQRYLTGSQITEADWRLFPTLLRFDAVYVGHFKCNLRRIIDYPNLHNYLLELYQQPGIAATVNMDHIKRHYYFSHESINPSRIVPVGPHLDFNQAHDRGRF